MLTYEYLVSIIFRWIDLGLIVALIAYAFWRWGLPFFKEERAKEEQILHDLEYKIDATLQEVHLFNKKLVDDSSRVEHLKNQIKLWQTITEKKRHDLSEQKRGFAQRLIQQHNKQMVFVKKTAEYKKIIPELSSQIENELHTMAQQPEFGKAFMQTIIEKLQKDDA